MIFVHHPILDCGNSTMDRKSPLKNRDQVRQILENFAGEVTVFCGHYHNLHTQKAGNITQHLV